MVTPVVGAVVGTVVVSIVVGAVVGTVVVVTPVVGAVVGTNEAGVSPLHAAPLANIERAPRQIAALTSLQRRG